MLTDRDTDFVRAILKYRFLELGQFEWLFPEASRRGMENRLRYLYHNKYLERLVYTEATHANKLIYAMAEKGARLLAEKGGVARDEIPWRRHLNQVTLSHVRHALSVNEALISLTIALGKAEERGLVSEYRVLHGDPAKHKIAVTVKDADGRRHEQAVVPDAVVGIKFKGGEFGLFFVEVDRATMSAERWQDKVRVDYEYARSPELRSRFRTGWFIVLTVTTSEKRILSLAERTVAMGGRRAFWYTTAERMTPEAVLERIWIRANDLYASRGERTHKVGDITKANLKSVYDAIGG
jgi:hypothetical protein